MHAALVTVTLGTPLKPGNVYRYDLTFTAATDDPDANNAVCWVGSLDGFAEIVLPACDRAVELAPDDGNARDSRGVARAITGDVQGAIVDFERFVSWARVVLSNQ